MRHIEERKRDEALRALFNDGKATEQEIKALAEKRRQQLRNDLKAQIDEKKAIQDQASQDQAQLANSGLPIGVEYVNRYDRYRGAHQAALKEQIDEKQKKTAAEREAERLAQEQYLRDLNDFQGLERQRREEAEAARKNHFRSEMERFNAERDAKKQQQLEAKQKELEAYSANQAKLAAEEAERHAAIKAREGKHRSDLQTQMSEHAQRKVVLSEPESGRGGEKEVQGRSVEARSTVQTV